MSIIDNKYVVINEHDLGKDKIDLLTDLLYESTGARIPKDKIKYGKPQVLDTKPDDLFDPNTFVPVIIDMAYDARYPFFRDSGFMYRRRSIVEHFKDVDLKSVAPPFYPFRTSDIIDQLNEKLKYPVDMDDLVEIEYKTAEDWEDGIRIQAHPESYLWFDGYNVEVDTSQVNHTNLFTVHTLDGFHIHRNESGTMVIPGFVKHYGKCGNLNCPVCGSGSMNPENLSKLDPRVVDYLMMTVRPVNEAFKNIPEAVITKVANDIVESKGQPIPIYSNEPYLRPTKPELPDPGTDTESGEESNEEESIPSEEDSNLTEEAESIEQNDETEPVDNTEETEI